jgi:hypothetical protein
MERDLIVSAKEPDWRRGRDVGLDLDFPTLRRHAILKLSAAPHTRD